MYTSPLAPGGCQGEPMPSPLDSPGAVPARNLNVSAFPPRSFPHSCNARFPFLTIEGMAPQPHYVHKSFRIRSYENTLRSPFLTSLESALTDTTSRKSFRIRSYKNTGGWGWSRLRLPSTFCWPFIFITLQSPFPATLLYSHPYKSLGVARRVISRTLPFLATRSIHVGLAVSRSSL